MSLQNRMAAIVKKAAVEVDADDANKRWARRKTAQTPAKILFDGITTPFECLVKDISSTGVQLEICKTKFNMDASSDAIPHYFTLINHVGQDCRRMPVDVAPRAKARRALHRHRPHPVLAAARLTQARQEVEPSEQQRREPDGPGNRRSLHTVAQSWSCAPVESGQRGPWTSARFFEAGRCRQH